MTTMATLIAERADAFMRHCVAGVTKQGKDKAAAFAICKAGGNRAGYYRPGTKKQTAKGTKAIRAHARAKDAPGKDAAYERAVKSEATMQSMRALIERFEDPSVTTKRADALVPGDQVVERDGAVLTVKSVTPAKGKVVIAFERYGAGAAPATTVKAGAMVRVQEAP
jgi:hypothetical protein